jgi:predicted amidohydrolase YtcJ
MLFLENARVYRYDRALRRFARGHTLLIDGERIVACDADPSGLNVERVDLEGATVLPAFADCHVHLAQTGAVIGARSLASVDSYAAFERAVEAIPNDRGIVYAGGYDDARWGDGAQAAAGPLERFHPDALALIVRVDGHSSIVNTKGFASLGLPPEIEGIERDAGGSPTGRLFLAANWKAQAAFADRTPLDVQRANERRAADLARSRGVAHLHAQLLGRTPDGYAQDVAFLRTLPVIVHPKICEPDAAIAHALGLPYVGGDVFLDGSIGSCTAALSQPYAGDRGSGALRFSDAQVVAYLEGAESLGMSAGVHAIGDAAIDQFVRAARTVLHGRPSPRGTHHFIEHFEMPRREHIEACSTMQVHLSMQPQFQATWGGDGGMYDERLGCVRRRAMNPMRALFDAGALVCGGSDSPVCALDPLAGMHAACTAQEPEFCLDPHDALALYTVNAAAFARAAHDTGNIEPGLRADLVVLDGDPLDGAAYSDCSVIRTMIGGV